MKNLPILNECERLSVIDIATGKEIAAITGGDTPITTATGFAVALRYAGCDSDVIVTDTPGEQVDELLSARGPLAD